MCAGREVRVARVSMLALGRVLGGGGGGGRELSTDRLFSFQLALWEGWLIHSS